MEKRFYIEELSEKNWPQWDELLHSLPYSTPYSLSWWLKSVCDVFGGTPRIFVVKDEKSNIVGGIGLRELKFLGKSIIAPSKLSLYMPIVFFNNFDFRSTVEIEREIAYFLKDNFDVIFSITNTKELFDIRAFKWLGYDIEVRYTAITDLTKFSVDIIDRSHRKQINKAQRASLVFKLSDDIKIMWKLWYKTFERQGISAPVDLDRLEYLYTEIKKHNSGQGFVVFSGDGEPASFRISIWSNNTTVYGWIAGTDPNYFQSGASSFAIWSALQYFRDNGFSVFDWCVANMESIADFKLSFGAKLTPYFSLKNIPLWFDVAYSFKKVLNKIRR